MSVAPPLALPRKVGAPMETSFYLANLFHQMNKTMYDIQLNVEIALPVSLFSAAHRYTE